VRSWLVVDVAPVVVVIVVVVVFVDWDCATAIAVAVAVAAAAAVAVAMAVIAASDGRACEAVSAIRVIVTARSSFSPSSWFCSCR